jgi:hemerythrin-like domain-containing protein
MIGAGIRDKGGPVGVLLSEHARGRQLIRDMEGSIAMDVDRMKLAQAAREYASLLRIHIHKENMVMFPMAERVLAKPQLEKLYAGFEEHAELHAMLKSLQEKIPNGMIWDVISPAPSMEE